jgi:hypothetical protein
MYLHGFYVEPFASFTLKFVKVSAFGFPLDSTQAHLAPTIRTENDRAIARRTE